MGGTWSCMGLSSISPTDADDNDDDVTAYDLRTKEIKPEMGMTDFEGAIYELEDEEPLPLPPLNQTTKVLPDGTTIHTNTSVTFTLPEPPPPRQQPARSTREQVFSKRDIRVFRLAHSDVEKGPNSEYARIGYYSLDQYMGEGSFARVYRATNKNNAHTVAAKVIAVESTAELASACREVDCLSRIDSPYIVSLLEVLVLEATADSNESFVCLISEFMPSGSTEAFMDCNGPLLGDLNKLRLIVQQLALALQHLHERKITHRDIKPQNVVFDTSRGLPIAKLCDLGLAKHTADTPHYSVEEYLSIGAQGGAALFRAPELGWQDLSQVDFMAADIWSMGLYFYYLVFGEHPRRPPVNLESFVVTVPALPTILSMYKDIQLKRQRDKAVADGHPFPVTADMGITSSRIVVTQPHPNSGDGARGQQVVVIPLDTPATYQAKEEERTWLVQLRNMLELMLLPNPSDRLTAKKLCRHPFLGYGSVQKLRARVTSTLASTGFQAAQDQLVPSYAPQPSRLTFEQWARAALPKQMQLFDASCAYSTSSYNRSITASIAYTETHNRSRLRGTKAPFGMQNTQTPFLPQAATRVQPRHSRSRSCSQHSATSQNIAVVIPMQAVTAAAPQDAGANAEVVRARVGGGAPAHTGEASAAVESHTQRSTPLHTGPATKLSQAHSEPMARSEVPGHLAQGHSNTEATRSPGMFAPGGPLMANVDSGTDRPADAALRSWEMMLPAPISPALVRVFALMSQAYNGQVARQHAGAPVTGAYQPDMVEALKNLTPAELMQLQLWRSSFPVAAPEQLAPAPLPPAAAAAPGPSASPETLAAQGAALLRMALAQPQADEQAPSAAAQAAPAPVSAPVSAQHGPAFHLQPLSPPMLPTLPSLSNTALLAANHFADAPLFGNRFAAGPHLMGERAANNSSGTATRRRSGAHANASGEHLEELISDADASSRSLQVSVNSRGKPASISAWSLADREAFARLPPLRSLYLAQAQPPECQPPATAMSAPAEPAQVPPTCSDARQGLFKAQLGASVDTKNGKRPDVPEVVEELVDPEEVVEELVDDVAGTIPVFLPGVGAGGLPLQMPMYFGFPGGAAPPVSAMAGGVPMTVNGVPIMASSYPMVSNFMPRHVPMPTQGYHGAGAGAGYMAPWPGMGGYADMGVSGRAIGTGPVFDAPDVTFRKSGTAEAAAGGGAPVKTAQLTPSELLALAIKGEY